MKSYIAWSLWAPQKGSVFSGVRMDFDKKGKQSFTKIRSSSEIVYATEFVPNVYFVKTAKSYYLVIVANKKNIGTLPTFGYARKIALGKKVKLDLVGWDTETERITKLKRLILTEPIKEIREYGDNVYILISESNIYYAMKK